MGTEQEVSGAELARLLLRAFESMVEHVEAELACRGFAGFTAANEFVLDAIDRGTGNAADLARALGVSRQAAAKSVATLEQLGYVERRPDPADARRKQLQVTPRGAEAHALGAQLLNDLRAVWSGRVGAGRLADLEGTLADLLA